MSTTDNYRFRESIRSRIQEGFTCLNRNYQAWLAWHDTMYDPNAHCNLYDQRFSLQQYKDIVGRFFLDFDIVLGDFTSLLVQNDWCAFRYTVNVTNRKTRIETKQNMMEFIHFGKDCQAADSRIIESWVFSDKPISFSG